MANPYLIEGPALISFSGGRTSGYMLWHILDAYDGKLPEDECDAWAVSFSSSYQTLRGIALAIDDAVDRLRALAKEQTND